jgi:transposase
MRQKSDPTDGTPEKLVRDIRRYSAEAKIRIVLDGLRGETPIAELCRRDGIAESMYYSWSKEFLEADSQGTPHGRLRRMRSSSSGARRRA